MMTVTVLNKIPVLLTNTMILSKAITVLRCHKKDKVRGSNPFEWDQTHDVILSVQAKFPLLSRLWLGS